MPKYFLDKIAGYYLYYTKHCVIECMHAHASDKKLTEGGSAKFFVLADGSTIIQNRGILNDRELLKIQKFIKLHWLKLVMTEAKKIAIANAAEMIVGGYAFLRKGENITIVNLNQKDEHVMVITKEGKMLESSMDPIEQVIALKKWKQNAQFMEDEIA